MYGSVLHIKLSSGESRNEYSQIFCICSWTFQSIQRWAFSSPKRNWSGRRALSKLLQTATSCVNLPKFHYFVLWANVLSDEESSKLSPFDNDRSLFHLIFTAIHWRQAFIKHIMLKMEAGACYFTIVNEWPQQKFGICCHWTCLVLCVIVLVLSQLNTTKLNKIPTLKHSHFKYM